jgi:hypothetical protein
MAIVPASSEVSCGHYMQCNSGFLSPHLHLTMTHVGRPHEVSQLHTSATNVEVDRLLDVVQICHKYELLSLAMWALDVCHSVVSSPSQASLPLSNLERNTIARMFRLASLCEHVDLLSTISKLLRRRMRNSSGAVSPDWIVLAMTLSDELDLPAMKGSAYMEMLQLGQDNWSEISPEQKFRLYAGYYQLTQQWEVRALDILPWCLSNL